MDDVCKESKEIFTLLKQQEKAIKEAESIDKLDRLVKKLDKLEVEIENAGDKVKDVDLKFTKLRSHKELIVDGVRGELTQMSANLSASFELVGTKLIEAETKQAVFNEKLAEQQMKLVSVEEVLVVAHRESTKLPGISEVILTEKSARVNSEVKEVEEATQSLMQDADILIERVSQLERTNVIAEQQLATQSEKVSGLLPGSIMPEMVTKMKNNDGTLGTLQSQYDEVERKLKADERAVDLLGIVMAGQQTRLASIDEKLPAVSDVMT